MTLLRKELAKVVAENRNLQKKISEIEGTLTKKNILLELEIDRLRLELAARDRRMETYENSDAASSTGSLYNAERAAFRKKMEKEDVQGTDLNQMTKTRHARGRLWVTPAHRTATRQKGQSRCTCANARGAGAGASPSCRPR